MKLVAGAHRTRPADLLGAETNNADRRLELASDEETHRHRCGVPAARRQPTEERISRRRGFIEMERLRIVIGGKGFHVRLLKAQARRAKFLANREILEIQRCHLRLSSR